MSGENERDPATLSLEERLAAVVDIEREIAQLHARQLRLIAAIVDDPCAEGVAPELDREWAKEELRAALGESAESVNSRIVLSRDLTRRLPATLAVLQAGDITLRHARLLTDGISALSDTEAAEIEAASLPFAARRDLSAFARKVRREVLKCDSRSIEEQVADALADRRVWARPSDYAMSTFGAVLPAEGAQLLMTALDDCVARSDTPERGTGPRWQGMRPSIHVSVALSTLLGADELPGELADYGPIPAEVARRLAADESGTWRRLVTDELGRLVDYGRTKYRPPADLRDFVIARDQTCVFPTCNRRACRCELDHAVPWPDGPTNADNLVALCSRHHHAKHDAGWKLHRLPDGNPDPPSLAA